MKRVFIACAGEATRWGEYLGVPKQLVPIDGVPLLHRTVKQLQERGISDIYVVARNDLLLLPGTILFTPDNCRWLVETILSTVPLWGEENIILLGDVYFTAEGLDTILDNMWPVAVFGREGHSEITGHAFGEIFALRVTNAALPRVQLLLKMAVRFAEMAKSEKEVGSIWRTAAILLANSKAVFIAGGITSLKKALGLYSVQGPPGLPGLANTRSLFWAALRLVMAAIRMVRSQRIHILGRLWSFYRLYTSQFLFTQKMLIDTTVFVSIDDQTDDFDSPQDYEGWVASQVFP